MNELERCQKIFEKLFDKEVAEGKISSPWVNYDNKQYQITIEVKKPNH